jgi:hypothetical protein
MVRKWSTVPISYPILPLSSPSQELQKQLAAQQQQQQMQAQMAAQMGGGGGGEQAKEEQSEFWYDLGGWVMLAGMCTAWVMLARVGSK